MVNKKGKKVFHASKTPAIREAEQYARPTQKGRLMERYTEHQLSWPSRHDREEWFLADRALLFASTLEATRLCREGRNPSRPRCVVGRDATLVEKILSYTDFHTVLVAGQRVNKQWYLFIYHSDLLKQMMFIKPLTTPGLRPFDASPGWCPEKIPEDMRHVTRGGDPADGGRVLNPYLVEKFGPVFFDFSEYRDRFRRSEYFYRMPWVRNTYDVVHLGDSHGLEDVVKLKRPEHGLESPSLRYRLDAAAKARADDKERRQRFRRLGASWRRMLIMQPPPAYLSTLLRDPIQPKEMAETDEDGSPRWEMQEIVGAGLPSDLRWNDRRSYQWNHRQLAKQEAIAQANPAMLAGRIDEGRMGHFYDTVAVIASNSFKNGRFFRVLWTEPKAPYTSERAAAVRTELLEKFGYVLEMYDEDYAEAYPQVGPDGSHAQTFIDTFWTQDTHWIQISSKLWCKTWFVTGPKPVVTPHSTLFTIQATHFPFDGIALVDKNARDPMLQAVERGRRVDAAIQARRAANGGQPSIARTARPVAPAAAVEGQGA